MGNEVWFLELIREPGNATAVYGFRSRGGGRQVWSSVPWMAPINPVTEWEILEELYAAVLDLMEHRAAI